MAALDQGMQENETLILEAGGGNFTLFPFKRGLHRVSRASPIKTGHIVDQTRARKATHDSFRGKRSSARPTRKDQYSRCSCACRLLQRYTAARGTIKRAKRTRKAWLNSRETKGTLGERQRNQGYKVQTIRTEFSHDSRNKSLMLEATLGVAITSLLPSFPCANSTSVLRTYLTDEIAVGVER